MAEYLIQNATLTGSSTAAVSSAQMMTEIRSIQTAEEEVAFLNMPISDEEAFMHYVNELTGANENE